MLSDNISRDESGALCFAGQRVDALADRWGTPLYLMDEDRIRQNCRMYLSAFRKSFGPDALPLGYVIQKEPKKARRTFAMQYSLLDALQKIADENGTNLNALVNDVLTDYATNYLNEDK